MASALEKIEQELVALMGDTGRSALEAALPKVRGGQTDENLDVALDKVEPINTLLAEAGRQTKAGETADAD